MTDEVCAEPHPDLAELALGVLHGRDRAAVLAHLSKCPTCAEREQQLSECSDALIDLVPASEPPVGFENRLLERLRAGQSPGTHSATAVRSGRRRASAVVLAVACGVALFAAGFVVRAQTQSPAVHPAALTASGGQTVGQVYLDTGPDPWVYVGVYGVHAGSVDCQVTYRDGRVEDLGSYLVERGKASWGARIGGDPSAISSARLIAPNGETVATAEL